MNYIEKKLREEFKKTRFAQEGLSFLEAAQYERIYDDLIFFIHAALSEQKEEIKKIVENLPKYEMDFGREQVEVVLRDEIIKIIDEV